ncbi:cobaltochelatase CobT-related protein [Glutamicibacter sp.]|uniref:cobaltochelatase CobT-related protein n=1 Tax=Glutamicibacter sp. TaxID=1931995 RepID=UPI0028BF5728|nr:cobalt chelatase [Glutamicibacter sp.]
MSTGSSSTFSEREIQQIRQLCAANLRALARDPQLTLQGRYIHRTDRLLPLNAPHLYPAAHSASFGSFRGASDGMALRVLHSDLQTHTQSLPEAPSARLIFEVLEQFRCESLATLDGVRANLRLRHETWSKEYLASEMIETSLGLLIYTILQVTRSRITGEPLIAESEDMIESTRAHLASSLGPLLSDLRRQRHVQHAFAQTALLVAELTAQNVAALEKAQGSEAADRKGQLQPTFDLLLDVESELPSPPSAASGRSGTLSDDVSGYRIFTTRFDRELHAETLVRSEQLAKFRERIAERVRKEAVNVHLVAKKLQWLLCVPENSGFDFGVEEGVLDGSRLGQLIASPTERRVFKAPRADPQAAAAVTILLDCSGSMKHHAESMAAFIDVLVRALERVEVPCEVLGYTTGSWNGGRVLKAWHQAGKPTHPGRLNELSHLIFKDFATSWRTGRSAMAAMLKPTLYRESVDGEAVRWAAARLGDQQTERRILVVISDGSPSDSATTAANDEHYLHQDLTEVVRGLHTDPQLTVLGIGLGLDMSPYFKNSLIIDAELLGGSDSVRELLSLLHRSLRN